MNLLAKFIAGIWAIFAPPGNQPVILQDQVLWVEIRHRETVDLRGNLTSEIILHDGPMRTQRVTSFPSTWCTKFIKHNDGSLTLVWMDLNGDVRMTQLLSLIETWEEEPNYNDPNSYRIDEGYSGRDLSDRLTTQSP